MTKSKLNFFRLDGRVKMWRKSNLAFNKKETLSNGETYYALSCILVAGVTNLHFTRRYHGSTSFSRDFKGKYPKIRY